MVQRYEGRVCPIHRHVEWELQDLGNNVPATNQELESVSYGENSSPLSSSLQQPLYGDGRKWPLLRGGG